MGGEKIPVVYWHTGNQDYLRTSLIRCKSYNTTVILLGDESNASIAKKIGVTYYSHEDFFPQEEWEEFETLYVHMSSNSKEFEINCFRRFFEIREYMRRENINRIVYSDSDIITTIDFSTIEVFISADAAMCVPEDQKPIRWVANCGVSLWTLSALEDFIEFVKETYRHNIEKLKSKWNYHCANKILGGICDMTLQYLWYIKEDNFKKINLSIANAYFDGVVDFCFRSAENYKRNEYKIDKMTRTKIVKMVDGDFYFVSNENEMVKARCIHFIGKSKVFMRDINFKGKISLAKRILFYIRRLI